MRVIKLLLIVCGAGIMASCSQNAYSTRDDSYLDQAKMAHLMVIPPGASAPEQEPYYSVPNKVVPANHQKPNLVPPGFHSKA
jgi:uncharacterized lipoprotein